MKLTNRQKHVFLKCAEELNELAVELLQAVNKPSKKNWGKIFDEIEDINSWVSELHRIRKIGKP